MEDEMLKDGELSRYVVHKMRDRYKEKEIAFEDFRGKLAEIIPQLGGRSRIS